MPDFNYYTPQNMIAKGSSNVSDNPVAVTQAPKASYQTMKTFTGTIAMTPYVANPSSAPTLATAANAGSTLAPATYYVKYTWVNATGESLPSPEASQAVSSGQQLNITLPSFPTGVTSANIYISTSSGTETKQLNTTSTSVSISTPLVAGSALPTIATINTYVQNLYTVTSGKTFYLTDIVATNNTANNPVQVSINASQTVGVSPVFIGHVLSTAPINCLNIGTEPSVASGTPVTLQVTVPQGSGATSVSFFVSGYEQ